MSNTRAPASTGLWQRQEITCGALSTLTAQLGHSTVIISGSGWALPSEGERSAPVWERTLALMCGAHKPGRCNKRKLKCPHQSKALQGEGLQFEFALTAASTANSFWQSLSETKTARRVSAEGGNKEEE